MGFQKNENNIGFLKTNRKTMLAFKKTENYIGIQKDEFEMSGFSARILFH